jgi:hypothetical protein
MFEQRTRRRIFVPIITKPFDVLVDGLLVSSSRGEQTVIGLFVAGMGNLHAVPDLGSMLTAYVRLPIPHARPSTAALRPPQPARDDEATAILTIVNSNLAMRQQP